LVIEDRNCGSLTQLLSQFNTRCYANVRGIRVEPLANRENVRINYDAHCHLELQPALHTNFSQRYEVGQLIAEEFWWPI